MGSDGMMFVIFPNSALNLSDRNWLRKLIAVGYNAIPVTHPIDWHSSMPLGIDPTVDFAFKQMHGNPEHTASTIHFLRAVLGIKISQVEILNPILGQQIDEDKLAILDIRAVDEQGRQFNIEMQTSLTAGLLKRLVYYAGSLYVRQLSSGESYLNLRPAISICVLDQTLFPHARLHSGFSLRDEAGDGA